MEHISYAYGKNHYDDDVTLKDVLHHVWPSHKAKEESLSQMGAYCGREVYEAVYHVDHDAHPALTMHDVNGRRVDRVRLSPAQRTVLQHLAKINRPPYEGGRWHEHYAQGYLIGDPGLYCILTISGQTAYAIHKYAPLFGAWRDKILDGDASGATWMTEVQGGSDLGANSTTARQDCGVWRLNGEKYFASGAGLADYALVTARPQGAKAGLKGLGLFLVPRLQQNGELNYHVQRLKDKSATRSVPSGEVEFFDSVAYLIGDVEKGIYYTLENLTVSRLANAAAAMGIGRKAHLEVLGRVQVRQTFGKLLMEHPLIRRDLTDFAVRLAAGLSLSFLAIDAFDKTWTDVPPYTQDYHYARMLGHLAKNRTADHAQAMTAMAMELFGGVGFLEEYAVARWHREAMITPIWEGPSNIQALDFLETTVKHNVHERLLDEVFSSDVTCHPCGHMARDMAHYALKVLRDSAPLAAEWQAKEALQIVADAVQVASLYQLAQTAGMRYGKMAELYAMRFLERREYPAWVGEDRSIWGIELADA